MMGVGLIVLGPNRGLFFYIGVGFVIYIFSLAAFRDIPQDVKPHLKALSLLVSKLYRRYWHRESLGTIAYIFYPFFPLKWTCAIAQLEGRINSYLNPAARKTVQQNIDVLFGSKMTDKEVGLLTRQFFEYRHLIRSLFVLTPKIDHSDLLKLFPLYWIEHLEHVLSLGKGVI